MRKQKKYWEMTTEEVVKFYNSLNKERETFKLSLEELLKSEIIIKEEISGKIDGIAGVRKHKMLPVLFIVVRSGFQGKGIGKKLMEKLHKILKERYSFIVLSVIKENTQAINFFKKFGYGIFGEKKGFYYMINVLNVKGKIVSKVLNVNQYVRSGLQQALNQPKWKYICLSIYGYGGKPILNILWIKHILHIKNSYICINYINMNNLAL